MIWAEEQGYVARTPLAHFRKPTGGNQELVVTPAQYQMLLDRTEDQEFKDVLLTVTWETRCLLLRSNSARAQRRGRGPPRRPSELLQRKPIACGGFHRFG